MSPARDERRDDPDEREIAALNKVANILRGWAHIGDGPIGWGEYTTSDAFRWAADQIDDMAVTVRLQGALGDHRG